MSGYRSHGGAHFELDAFVRPDEGDGYGPGECYEERISTLGDLCCMIFGNSHGQIVETQVRSEEWEIFIPRREPAKNWGQTFVSHGVSLATLSFWGSNGGDEPVSCEVRIRRGGPDGEQVGPARRVAAHESPDRPIIRYPEIPGQLPGHEAYYTLPCDFFQVAYAPDEVRLKKDETYYVELSFDDPIMLYADGEYYYWGHAWYEGEKVDELPQGRTFHSTRWTLMMNIVTYENPGGEPNRYEIEPPRPAGEDGNLIVNGGAETGDFTWWRIGGDAKIDPSTDIPEPANHGGRHRFGTSVGWMRADQYQFQEVEVTPGTSYVAGMWVSHSDGTHESAELLWCDGPFGGKERRLAGTGPEASKRWTRLESRPFEPTQSTATIIVRYRHPEPSNIASIHVDDIFMKRVD